MAKALLIAEKPSLMRDIKNVYTKNRGRFKDQIDFVTLHGHIMGLKNPKEVDPGKYGKPWKDQHLPEIYPYEYKVTDGKTMSQIREKLKTGGYDYVIHAGDPEQEGELLVREVLIHLKNKLPVKRFWTNDTTDGAVLGELLNLHDDKKYDGFYDAALARQHADYQFGMNCTVAVSLKTDDLCKIGRVKAAVIGILAKRELEIQNYVEKKTYKPAFRYKGCEFVNEEVFDTPEAAMKKVPKTQYADIAEAKYEKKQQKAPKLYKLSTLQTEAHARFGWDADYTLNGVMQKLYEAKAISYPRTGCDYISSQVDIGLIAKRVLGEVDLDKNLLTREPSDVLKDKTYANDKAIQEEGHTAVIPTGNGLPKGASADEAKLYELVVRRFLAIFGAPKETMSVKVTGVPSGTKDPYVFTESYDLSPGYELVLNPGYKMKESLGVKFEKGQNIHPIEFFPKELVNKKPSRYNNGTLVQAMETPEKYDGEDGKVAYIIGTPATRSNIIKECQANGYFTVQKGGSYVATEKALQLYIAFGETVPMFNPVESGKWEELLSKVRKGEVSGADVEKLLIDAMKDSVESIQGGKVGAFDSHGNAGGKGGKGGQSGPVAECPSCHSPVKSGQYGLYCAGKCGIVFGKVYGKQLTDAQWKKVMKGERVLLKDLKSQKGTTYSAYVKPEGVENYSYTKSDGTEIHGKRIKFKIDEFYNGDKDKER